MGILIDSDSSLAPPHALVVSTWQPDSVCLHSSKCLESHPSSCSETGGAAPEVVTLVYSFTHKHAQRLSGRGFTTEYFPII